MEGLAEWPVLRLITLGLAALELLCAVVIVTSLFRTRSDLAGEGMARAYGVIAILLTVLFTVPALVLVLSGDLVVLALILVLVPALPLLARLVI